MQIDDKNTLTNLIFNTIEKLVVKFSRKKHTVNERNIEKTDKTLIDVSSYANVIYIINVTSENGQVYTKKLIKN